MLGSDGAPDHVERLIGRDRELATTRSVVEAARAGRSGALVLRGDAGVGKSALLREVARQATGFQILAVGGVQSEIALGYAALQRLLHPLQGGIEGLPPPQRDALETVFGLAEHDSSERFLVSLAALTLLTEAGATRPVCVLVDDAQWIDRESRGVLGFIGRRLNADAVALVMAIRDGIDVPPQPEGLPTLAVEALDRDSARRLLLGRVGASVREDVARRVLSETAGLPLAIVEVVRSLTDDQLGGHAPLPADLPVGERLEQHFQAQVAALSADAQLLSLIAAADTTGGGALVHAAAAALGIASFSEEEIERTGLLAFGPTVEFRHPLVRSAVYSGARAVERRRVHQALADATDARAQPDVRAWHYAAGAVGPDEEIASALWISADVARAHGGYAAEAAFRARAAELTPEPALRGRRFVGAARAHLAGGAAHAVAPLVARARPLLEAAIDHAEAQELLATCDMVNTPASVAGRLLGAAQIAQTVDAEAGRRIYGEALGAALVSFHLARGTSPSEIGAATLRSLQPPDPSDAVGLLVDGFARRLAVGYEDAFPVLRRAVDALRDDLPDSTLLQPVVVLLNTLGFELWDATAQYELLRDMAARDRDAGALDSLRHRVEALAHYAMFRGNFDEAAALHDEGADVAVAMGVSPVMSRTSAIELHALQGEEARVRASAAFLLGEEIEAVGAGIMANMARMGLVLLDLACGRYRDAFDGAWLLFELDPPATGNQVLPELVEAGVRCGETARAATALERLHLRARISGTPWALGLLARSQALLAGDDAEHWYEAALDHLAVTDVAVDLARTHLVFGEWLRRRRRRVDAREHLRCALEMFDGMGARSFGDRAVSELAATGERTRRRTVDTADDLTPQEARVARLAATGATNREIAAQLFISAATVEHHLHHVFRKLGVTSRFQLSSRHDRLVSVAGSV
jgi:DNA-binding CsgD family transcriptional regulator